MRNTLLAHSHADVADEADGALSAGSATTVSAAVLAKAVGLAAFVVARADGTGHALPTRTSTPIVAAFLGRYLAVGGTAVVLIAYRAAAALAALAAALVVSTLVLANLVVSADRLTAAHLEADLSCLLNAILVAGATAGNRLEQTF